MKTITSPLLAVSLLLTHPASASVRWELTGTLNYVNPLLSGTFTVGQTFTIRMDLDDSVPLSNGQRSDFYTSTGSFENAVSNGNVTFSTYAADFAAVGLQGGIQVRNNETDAAFGYDQLNLSFFNYEPGAISAPEVAGFELRSVEFNFTDETAPRDMITGNGGTFPSIDVPFIGPDTFDFSKSSNSPYHFILRFSGGAVDGTNFIRGTILSSSFTTGGGGFANWPALAGLPENQRGPLATPAGDKIPNLVKYAIGVGPLDSAAGRIPQEVVEGSVEDEIYPVVSFVRDTAASGIDMRVEVANDLDFAIDLGTTVVSTEDLGDGTERVTVRSNARFADAAKQFFRLKVSGE
ncbi:MAG TPA: hypothetical protein VLO11_08045 [Luteolibacter sp.]|nr:hypothetical protein [Luteolibacter sp.]